jgi:outer membrane protein TolC
VGLIKPLELFDSETRLLNAEADYLAAVYDLQLARSGLKFAVGGGF